MNKTMENATREQVAKFLPAALQRAADSYHDFMSKQIPQEPKPFSEHHAACKVAIAHVELLLKLARWADIEVQVPEDIHLSPFYQDSIKENQDFIENEGDDEDLV